MNLRKATEKDIPQLIELMTQLSEKYKMTTDQMKARFNAFQATNHHLIVAEEEGNILGLVAFVVYDFFREPGKSCYMDALVVDKNHQGKGVGSQLESYVDTYAKENGILAISLNSSDARKQTGTHAFYSKHGFLTHTEIEHTFFTKRVVTSDVKEEKTVEKVLQMGK